MRSITALLALEVPEGLTTLTAPVSSPLAGTCAAEASVNQTIEAW